MKEIKKKFTDFSSQFYSHMDESKFEIEKSKTGVLTALYNKKYLHSKYDPLREAKRIAEQFVYSSGFGLIFFGPGLGYGLIEILKKIPISKQKIRVFIIEPSKWIFEKFSELNDLEILKKFEVYWVATVEDFIKFYVDGQYQSVEFSLFTDMDFYNSIKNIYALMKASFKTKNKFRKLILKNSLKNLKSLSNKKIFSIQEKQTDIPGIVVGAGPSLNMSQLEQLSKIQDSVVIVASDTVYPLLLKNDITPDFVFVGDPQFINYKHFFGLESSKTFLVSDISVHPYTLAQFSEKYIYVDTGSPITKIISQDMPLTFLKMGGSVTAGAFFFLLSLGIKKVYFLGQDFVSEFDKSHSPYTLYDYLFMQQQNKFQTFSNLHRKILGNHYEIVGENSFTNSLLKTYRDWLIAEIQQLQDVSVVNVSEKSLFHSSCIKKGNLEDIKSSYNKQAFIDSIIIERKDLYKLKTKGNLFNFKFLDIKKTIASLKNQYSVDLIEKNRVLFYVYDWFYSGEMRYLNKEKFGEDTYFQFLDRVEEFYYTL